MKLKCVFNYKIIAFYVMNMEVYTILIIKKHFNFFVCLVCLFHDCGFIDAAWQRHL